MSSFYSLFYVERKQKRLKGICSETIKVRWVERKRGKREGDGGGTEGREK